MSVPLGRFFELQNPQEAHESLLIPRVGAGPDVLVALDAPESSLGAGFLESPGVLEEHQFVAGRMNDEKRHILVAEPPRLLFRSHGPRV